MSVSNRPLATVTGASSGIGFALAKACAGNGFDLVLATGEVGGRSVNRTPSGPGSWRA